MTISPAEQFGAIDIYLFDQILRGNIRPDMRILDAGCGMGRNLIYLLREHCDLTAIDANPDCVDAVRRLSFQLNAGLPGENFIVSPIEQIPFPDSTFGAVICNSVLHFAETQKHFLDMLSQLWRVLKPGGLLFTRLGSRIGMDFVPLGGNRFLLPDGSEWFLVDEAMLMHLTHEMGGVLVDPLKTTIVQNHRCMTTWVLRKQF